jgi:hypothetical protein
MKKVNFIVVAFFLLVSLSLNAQNRHSDFFVGKWDITAVGTPGGDSKLIVNLARKNGKLEGVVIRSGQDPTEISKVEETKDAVKVYFRHNIIKVNLSLVKKDVNHSTGSLMGKYPAKGTRIN